MALEIPRLQELNGLWLIDTQHLGNPGTVGSYLLPGEDGRFALVETGPGSTLEALEAGITEAGFALSGLEAILLTHIHLDHAGAAGALAARSGAAVYVHEVGAPHLADPSRLLASAKRIYGAQMGPLWGAVKAVPEAQLRPLAGGETLRVLGRELRVIHTPGHASHHVSYLLDDGSLFTGDAADIRLPGSAVIRPALPPPDIDLETWEASVAAMRAARPARLLLTHFGVVDEAEGHLRQVPERNRRWAEAILEGMRAGEDEAALEARTAALGDAELAAEGAPPEVVARHQATSNYRMTVQGASRYWSKHRPARLAP